MDVKKQVIGNLTVESNTTNFVIEEVSDFACKLQANKQECLCCKEDNYIWSDTDREGDIKTHVYICFNCGSQVDLKHSPNSGKLILEICNQSEEDVKKFKEFMESGAQEE